MDLSSCRICVKKCSEVNIFETIACNDVVANLIIDLADVECSPGDELPNGICNTCLNDVKRAHSLRKLIRTSDSKLRDLLEGLMGEQPENEGDTEEIEILVKQQDSDSENEAKGTDVKYSLSIQPVKWATPKSDEQHPEGSVVSYQDFDLETVKENESVEEQEDEPMEEEELIDENSLVEQEDSLGPTSDAVPAWVAEKKKRMLQANRAAAGVNTTDPTTCCCSCEQTFGNEEEVITHARIQHKVMVTDLSDDTAEEKSSSKSNVRCKVCLKEFRNLSALRSHRLRFLSMKQCPECGTMVAKKRFSVHLRTHDENPVECDICGLQLKSERMMGPHKKTHEVNGYFKCDECTKEFTNEMAYQRHVNHHRYRKQPFRFSCEQCGKGFRSPGQLRSHMRIHTGEKPYTCEHCDQSFTHKTDHRRHMWTHTGSPYVCQACGKDFQRPSHLRQHELGCRKVGVSVKEEIEPQAQILYYECGDCSEQFQTETAFAEHIAHHE